MTFYCVNCCPMSHLFHFRPLRISFRADPGLAPSYPRDLLILNQRATDPLLVVDPKPRLETLKAEVASLEGSNLSMLLPSWRHIKPRRRKQTERKGSFSHDIIIPSSQMNPTSGQILLRHICKAIFLKLAARDRIEVKRDL